MDTPNARPLTLAERLHHRPGQDPRAPRPDLTSPPGTTRISRPHRRAPARPPPPEHTTETLPPKRRSADHHHHEHDNRQTTPSPSRSDEIHFTHTADRWIQAKAQLRRINEITKEQKELFAELTALIQAHAPQLLQQRSIGTVTAAVIIGRTAGAQRFRSEACFARHAGTAPIPASSGKTVRHRLHRGGDRQLNRAIHIIALGRIAWDPETRAYIERRVSDGKTKREAIRCLKRHIARQIWHLLYNTQPTTPAPVQSPIARVRVGAPGLMPCTR